MKTPLRSALLLALLLTAASAQAHPHPDSQRPAPPIPGIAHGEPQSSPTDARHIALLEQMLRDAGIQPPDRPDAADNAIARADLPVVPDTVQTDGFEPWVVIINRKEDDAAPALARIRVWLNRDNESRVLTAANILDAVQDWADLQFAAVQAAAPNDPVAAYMIAEDALRVVRQDPIGEPLEAYVRQLQSNRSEWRKIEAMAAYRRVMQRAEETGLTGDWEQIDFQNDRTRTAIEDVRSHLGLITRHWRNTEAADAAQAVLRDWAQREARAIAELPAWRYVWNISLIHLGTEESTTIHVDAAGLITITEEQRQVYDPRNIIMYGTFRNTSDRPYRYTFTVGVSSRANDGRPWTGNDQYRTGISEVQTPVLAPGELYEWSTQIAVQNAWVIRQGGVANVEALEP